MAVRFSLIVCSLLLVCAVVSAEQLTAVGPNGGDVRSLAADPRNSDHLLLGTSTGTLFQSTNGGRSWSYFTHLGRGDDYVVDHIIFDSLDSKRIYVAVWSVESHRSGELFRSFDAGKSWKTVSAMHGKSIRALTLDARSHLLLAGALDGVYRSKDGGRTWLLISRRKPAIRNVESVAIDPSNPKVFYAGTWHLAWKTADGGNTWHKIDQGMIDDSDIFSILVDRSDPHVIFASACSGIYKSTNRGDLFERIQQMPFSARRSRILKQDSNDPAVIYAGTTEGLWVTKDSGNSWKRVTSPDLVVNDIVVDSRASRRVLVATDRAGVLASNTEDLHFEASNEGFTHRYISSILVDNKKPDTLYVSVVNDRDLGGVFVSSDSGRHWIQQSAGLADRDVLTLKQDAEGLVIAGTNHGLFRFDRAASEWIPLGTITQTPLLPQTPRVNDVDITSSEWLLATSAGLYASSDYGLSWIRNAAVKDRYLVAVQRRGPLVAIGTPRSVLVSRDKGHSWQISRTPRFRTMKGLVITPGNRIVIATDTGFFCSPNSGKSWIRSRGSVQQKNISSIHYDENQQRLLVSVEGSSAIFKSDDYARTWHRTLDTGYPLRQVNSVSGKIVAVTRFEGIVLSGNSDERPILGSPSER